MSSLSKGKLPVFKHQCGRWCKTVKCRHRYFFKIADDPDGSKSVQEWLRCKDYWLAGLEAPYGDENRITLKQIANEFIHSKKLKLDAGDLSLRTFNENFATCKFILSVLGESLDARMLTPVQFRTLRLALESRNSSPNSRGKFIGQIRSIFSFAFKNQLVERPVVYGTEFDKPSMKVKRLHRAKKGDRTLSLQQFRALLANATPTFKAILLLAIQSGIGNVDVAGLQWTDLSGRWLTAHRGKTGIIRRIPLLPVTLQAINAQRIDDRKLLFYRPHGGSWSNTELTSSMVSGAFRALCKQSGVEGHSFYDLRRTFQTIAEEHCRDIIAIRALMGHVDFSMTGVYRQRINDARLIAVVNIMDRWMQGALEGNGIA